MPPRNLPPVTLNSLENSLLPVALPSTKVQLSLLSVALADALAAPSEFKRRGTFRWIDKMIVNSTFGTPAGTFTDDTSMTLCLAEALIDYPPPTASSSTPLLEDAENSADAFLSHLAAQARNYVRWRNGVNGYMSPVGYCFDVGITVSGALRIWSMYLPGSILPASPTIAFQPETIPVQKALEKVRVNYSIPARHRGNGSLMRCSPVGLSMWRCIELAEKEASKQSIVTHPEGMCVEACKVYTRLLCKIFQWSEELSLSTSTTKKRTYTKKDLLDVLSSYPYTYAELRNLFTYAKDLSSPSSAKSHPILSSNTKLEDVSSSGYVLHTLHCALYIFFNTPTFESGAIEITNLGDDSDTVGAVYGGIAGAWYGDVLSPSPSDIGSLYWSDKVREWRRDMYDGEDKAMSWVEELGRRLAEEDGGLSVPEKKRWRREREEQEEGERQEEQASVDEREK